ncbi:MAG: protein translocase subunit SecF, partial [Clostridia bacterium]
LGKKYVSSTTKSTTDSNIAIIRTGTAELTNEQQSTLLTELDKTFSIDHTKVECEINSVSATIGSGLIKTAILSVLIAVVLMLGYITFRFKFSSALAAITCLIHDVLIMMTLYTIFQIPVNINIIAALLTILGYSINATIILFDRVRENQKRDDTKPFGQIVNEATSQTVARSVNTTLTTLLTIGMIYIFGVSSIRNFALPLIVGIVAGLFSSLFLSGMLWDSYAKFFSKFKKDKSGKKTKISKKVKAK